MLWCSDFLVAFARSGMPVQGLPVRWLAADYFSILMKSTSNIRVENGLMLPRSCAL